MKIAKKILQKLLEPKIKYQPLIQVRVFKDALLYNLEQYTNKYPHLQFVPVLKSNAYGHGLVQVASLLDNKQLPFFMVDSFYEAIVLRQNEIQTKILVLGYCRTEDIVNNKLKNLSFGIIDFAQLKNISAKLTRPQNFHLKIDTGMHRQGIPIEQIPDALKLIKLNKNISIEGLCSHFADADGKTPDFTNKQIQIWNGLVKTFKAELPLIKYFHTSNTAGAAYAKNINANVSRLGLGLYGINTSSLEKLNLKPALEMRSIISSKKIIQAGEHIGYNLTYQAKNLLVVATVPVGYNEGVDRRLSNQGFFKIGQHFCPIVGRVSMNMTSIDITAIPDIQLEEEVIVISPDPEDKNSIENIAKTSGGITHEILVHIPASLKRVVV